MRRGRSPLRRQLDELTARCAARQAEPEPVLSIIVQYSDPDGAPAARQWWETPPERMANHLGRTRYRLRSEVL